MGRVVIYGLLSCLIVFTAYLFATTSSDKAVSPEVRMAGKESPAEQPAAENLPANKEAGEGPVETPWLSDLRTPFPAETERGLKKEADLRRASKAAESFRSGDYDGAIKLYTELSEVDKSAFAGIGFSYFKLGDFENAKTFLERAAENNPNDFDVRKSLAFLYYRKDDIEKGLSHAEAGLALKKDPELRKLYGKLAKDKDTRDVSLSESSEHFRINFDGYKHGGMSRKVLGILEDAYGAVGKEFGHFPSEPVSAILYTNKDFYDITRAPEWSSGIYDGRIRIPVRGAEANETVLKKVLFHEYTHAVVRSLTPKCPLWINEGLAEYFSNDYKNKIGQVIPLNSLETSFSWLSREKIGLAYWESYSAVCSLIEKYGVYRMKEFLQSLSAGAELEQAFKGAFGITYSEFVSSWGKG